MWVLDVISPTLVLDGCMLPEYRTTRKIRKNRHSEILALSTSAVATVIVTSQGMGIGTSSVKQQL